MWAQVRIVCVFIPLLVFAGCSASLFHAKDPLIEKLSSRGPVLVATDNPYLSAHEFLLREIEKNPNLKGFIEHQGFPHAIEVSSSPFTNPIVQLFYPEQGNVFTLEMSGDRWFIDGPNMVAPETLAQITLLQRHALLNPPQSAAAKKETSLALAKQLDFSSVMNAETRARQATSAAKAAAPAVEEEMSDEESDREASAGSTAFSSPSLPADAEVSAKNFAVHIPLSKPARKSPAAAKKPAAPPAAAKAAPVVSDAVAQKIPEVTPIVAQNPFVLQDPPPAAKPIAAAPISTKGDVLHKVQSSQETLGDIARWYTKEKSNEEKIARINGLHRDEPLNVGDTVLVPGYLAKSKAELTE